MSRIGNIKILEEFTNNNITYGYYWAEFNGKYQLFIRNGNKFAVASHYSTEEVTKCLNYIREDVEKELLEAINSSL